MQENPLVFMQFQIVKKMTRAQIYETNIRSGKYGFDGNLL